MGAMQQDRMFAMPLLQWRETTFARKFGTTLADGSVSSDRNISRFSKVVSAEIPAGITVNGSLFFSISFQA